MSQISPQKPSLPPSPRFTPNFLHRYVPWLYAFWKFSRPHTIVGTTLSVIGMYVITGAIAHQPLTLAHGLSLLLTLLACLGGNVYIVGLNQLSDVGIDRVNKPHLPLASGEFSPRAAQIIIGIAGVLAVVLALWQGRYLFVMVGISLLLGTAYSLPPLRLKRFPFWASFCIFTVRGVVVNLGLCLHFNQVLHQPPLIPLVVWVLTGFILVFTFAIAIFKDIPDLEGDRRYQITTLTIQLGVQAVFNLARWVLTGCYLGMIGIVFFLPQVNVWFVVTSHLLLLALLWQQSLGVDLTNKRAIARFYQFIWKLFFLEYILFPIALLLA